MNSGQINLVGFVCVVSSLENFYLMYVLSNPEHIMRIGNICHNIKRIQNSNNKSTETKLYNIPAPTISEYIENRFKPQLRWYENKARDNMVRFRILRISIIVLALLTSIINAIGLVGNNVKATQLFTAIVTAVILDIGMLLFVELF
jgi:predicted membrane protein